MTAVGIDLGTTYSCVAVFERDHVEIIPTGDGGGNVMPSFVAFQQQGGMLVGDDAKASLRTLPQDRVIFDSKRLIGRRFADIDEEELRLLPYSVVEGKSGGVAISLPGKEEKKKKEESSLQRRSHRSSSPS